MRFRHLRAPASPTSTRRSQCYSSTPGRSLGPSQSSSPAAGSLERRADAPSAAARPGPAADSPEIARSGPRSAHPPCTCHIWPRAVRGHRRPSEAIRGHQRSSEVIRGDHKRYQIHHKAIRGRQRAIKCQESPPSILSFVAEHGPITAVEVRTRHEATQQHP
jgi:hypothetical protein